MWRIPMIVLLSALAGAQTIAGQEQPAATQPSRSAETSGVRIVARYDKLRRGRDEQIAIAVPLSSTSINCPGSGCTKRYVYPELLELEPQQGFTFKFLGLDHKFKTGSLTGLVSTRGGKAFLAQIEAAHDLRPGNYTIRGKLTLIESENHSRFRRNVDIAIPVTVVEHGAKVKKNPWTYDLDRKNPVMNVLEWTVLAPFAAVALGFYWVACQFDDC